VAVKEVLFPNMPDKEHQEGGMRGTGGQSLFMIVVIVLVCRTVGKIILTILVQTIDIMIGREKEVAIGVTAGIEAETAEIGAGIEAETEVENMTGTGTESEAETETGEVKEGMPIGVVREICPHMEAHLVISVGLQKAWHWWRWRWGDSLVKVYCDRMMWMIVFVNI
jgi:hypothetical protein